MMELAAAPSIIEALWQELHGELLAFARPRLASESEAEDVLQIAFLRAYDQLESGTRPNNARAWLFQIVRNLVVDTYRQSARRREVADDSAIEREVDEPAESSEVVDDDAHALLAKALPVFIGRLRSPYREALQLVEIDGLTQAEAAKRSGVSLSGMKSRVQRARKQLLESLNDCCEFVLDARNRVVDCHTHKEEETPCSSAPCGDDLPISPIEKSGF